MFTVVRQARIPASVTQTWEFLTEPSLLKKWFAEADRFEMGKPFRLNFGDGDFFAGIVREWQEPWFLRVEWKFMNLGPLFDISFILSPLQEVNGAELTVIDRGSLTTGECQSLREGWDDFLSRLVKLAQTGQSARYLWSQTFGAGAILKKRSEGDWPHEISDRTWWSRMFPECEVEMRGQSADVLHLGFRDAAWEGAETEARINVVSFDFGIYLSLTHEGWIKLPETQQISERRRYAGLWFEALQALEHKYG